MATNLDSKGIDLLNKMLNYDPAGRITAEEALEHVNYNVLLILNFFRHILKIWINQNSSYLIER